MSEKYNCPNCGAPIGFGSICEYCGTVLHWIPSMYIEYIPKHLNVREACVATRVRNIDTYELSGGEVVRHLADKLTDFIIQERAFDLIVTDDLYTDEKIIRMRTFIGRKENG